MLKNINNKNFINGEFVEISSSNYINVINPSKLEVIGQVPFIDEFNINKTINAAKNAQLLWKNYPLKTRSKLLKDWFNLLVEHIDYLTEILVLEQGKPKDDAKREIMYGANFIDWFANLLPSVGGKISEGVKPNQEIVTLYEPVGVVAAITPWNFPSAMVARKIAPAIAAGCSVILKPSELTPFSALILGKLAKYAGIPDGVINIITGYADYISDILLESKIIKKLTFTGSTKVGKILYKKSANSLKKLSLELGGNAPFIVFDDCDLDVVINDLIAAKLRSSGQACTSPNRIFLHENIHDIFISKLNEKFKELRVGDGFNSTVNVGPLINRDSSIRIKELITDAKNKGAEVKFGGDISEFYYDFENKLQKTSDQHSFFEPTIIVNCNDQMNIFYEEIFGPVIACYKFKTDQEVIDLANATDYGLSSYFYTNNYYRITNLSAELDFGMVGINESIVSNEIGAFAGRKFSGFGVEGSHLGLFEFMNTKYICKNNGNRFN